MFSGFRVYLFPCGVAVILGFWPIKPRMVMEPEQVRGWLKGQPAQNAFDHLESWCVQVLPGCIERRSLAQKSTLSGRLENCKMRGSCSWRASAHVTSHVTPCLFPGKNPSILCWSLNKNVLQVQGASSLGVIANWERSDIALSSSQTGALLVLGSPFHHYLLALLLPPNLGALVCQSLSPRELFACPLCL